LVNWNKNSATVLLFVSIGVVGADGVAGIIGTRACKGNPEKFFTPFGTTAFSELGNIDPASVRVLIPLSAVIGFATGIIENEASGNEYCLDELERIASIADSVSVFDIGLNDSSEEVDDTVTGTRCCVPVILAASLLDIMIG